MLHHEGIGCLASLMVLSLCAFAFAAAAAARWHLLSSSRQQPEMPPRPPLTRPGAPPPSNTLVQGALSPSRFPKSPPDSRAALNGLWAWQVRVAAGNCSGCKVYEYGTSITRVSPSPRRLWASDPAPSRASGGGRSPPPGEPRPTTHM